MSTGQSGLWQPTPSDKEREFFTAVVKHLIEKKVQVTVLFPFSHRDQDCLWTTSIAAVVFGCGEEGVQRVSQPYIFPPPFLYRDLGSVLSLFQLRLRPSVARKEVYRAF